MVVVDASVVVVVASVVVVDLEDFHGIEKSCSSTNCSNLDRNPL